MATVPSFASGGITSGSGGPQPKPEEFAGLGLSPGVVRGARSFKVDQLGRLTGVVHAQVWRPGENVCECRKGSGSMTFSVNWASLYGSPAATFGRELTATRKRTLWERLTGKKPKTVSVQQKPTYTFNMLYQSDDLTPEPPHTMAKCACGFYGYYDGSDDYYKDGYVSGVIEGYGETLIGTRGFRAEKARIVALMIPASQDRFANRIARNYAGLPLFERFADMVREFPPDGSELAVSPEDGDDFWTRKA